MAEERRPGRNVSLGTVAVRGGTRRQASSLVDAVNQGLAAGAASLFHAGRARIEFAELKLRLPAGAGASDIAQALEHAIARAIKDKGS